MDLFSNFVLFDEGCWEYVDYGLPDTELKLWRQFFGEEESDQYFKNFLETAPLKQRERKMYDKVVLDQRLTAFYGIKGEPFTPQLLAIKERIEPRAGQTPCDCFGYFWGAKGLQGAA
jgi:hypothetical protein